MKLITNFRNATSFDCETNDLLDNATKFHVLSYKMADGVSGSIEGSDAGKLKRFYQHHMDKGIPVVAHNGIGFDIPVSEKILGIDLSELMVIDTLYLSWYLNINRKLHGLDSFLLDYGVAKPKISDWQGLSYEEYKHRCEEDVKIQVPLWEDLRDRLIDMCTQAKEAIDSGLVGGTRMDDSEVTYLDQFVNNSTVDEYVDRTLTFLMFKADTAALRSKCMLEMDIPHIDERIETFGGHIDEAKSALEAVMPDVPKYADRDKPKNPYKKAPKNTKEKVFLVDGERMVMGVHGKSWNKQISWITDNKTDEFGNKLAKRVSGKGDVIKVLKKLEPPNANSGGQLKIWLFSHGWKPQTFDYKDDEPAIAAWKDGGYRGKPPAKRMIPQISKDGDDGKELCPSVLKLAEKVPQVMHYQKYTTVKHRLDTFKGWRAAIVFDKFIRARCGGLTNTLREKHRGVVNVPGVHKPYGQDMRKSFIAGEGKIALGSDLSSLEDRCKHHFMLPHDPKYVKTMMADDYDPHMTTALSAGMVTQQEFEDFMNGIKPESVTLARRAGKETNYASTYNAQPPTIARSAGVDLETGKKLFEGYWKLNWSVKKIAEEQYVFTCKQGLKWLVNPINGMCYSLRKEGDRFSTLNQGTGSFFFDIWVDNMLEAMQEKYGHKTLNLAIHDEVVLVHEDTPELREGMKEIVVNAISKVNKTYKLRRKLGCDVQFGIDYSEIH